MSLIKKGFLPSEMEDKWHLHYYDSCLYMKSAWTTFTAFVVRFDEGAKKPIATEIYANKDPEQQVSEKIDDKSDKYIVDSVIDVYLLKKFKK